MELIESLEFSAQWLFESYPPSPTDRNKQLLYAIASPANAVHGGVLRFARYKATKMPPTISRSDTTQFKACNGFFAYPPPTSGNIDWHLNFAHRDLFSKYGGPLFAQDEIQVAEHHALASLRHALLAQHKQPFCVEDDTPTPALISGVERRCAVSTVVTNDDYRRVSIYGNDFAFADPALVRKAVRPINSPTCSNILAMEAPRNSAGVYTKQQINFILSTAMTGFEAVKSFQSTNNSTAIHSGYWGCGAYGGNRVLMSLLQMIAACAADIDTLVIYVGDDSRGFDSGFLALQELLPVGDSVDVAELVEHIFTIGYRWGTCDGN